MEGFQNNTTTAATIMPPPTSHDLNCNAPATFVRRTYDLVNDPSTDSFISWGPSNNSLIVWNEAELVGVLYKHFKHNNLSSFTRQLNNYGFSKVNHDRFEYAHKSFLRGQEHLLKTIRKKEKKEKPADNVQRQQQQPHGQISSVGACVEVGKFGLEGEVERLKRDKEALRNELVILRRQQQSSDHQLQTLGQRMLGMEQRQQQMMSFLAKAMQNPGFLAQVLQQQNENNRLIAGPGVNKKRRLPQSTSTACDGQIVKYQPLMNEAAQAMLMQLNLASPSHVDTIGGGISIDDIPSPSSAELEDGNISLSEVAPTPGHSIVPFSEYSGMRPSAAITEIESPGAVTDTLTTDISSADRSILDALEEELLGSPRMQDMGLENEGIEIESGADGHGTVNGGEVYNDSLWVDGTITPLESGHFSPDQDMDMMVDENTAELPSINHSFWEQFLPDDNNNGWNMDGELTHYNMDQLTQQMGSLTSPQIDVAA